MALNREQHVFARAVAIELSHGAISLVVGRIGTPAFSADDAGGAARWQVIATCLVALAGGAFAGCRSLDELIRIQSEADTVPRLA